MKLNKNIIMGSGIIAAFGSTICCWGPALLAGVAGLTGTAYLFSWLHPLKPYLAGIAVISLSIAFYQAYRKKNTEDAGCQYCVAEQKKKSRITKTVLWAVTIFAALSFGYPYYSSTLLANTKIYSQVADTTKNEKEVELKVTGMSCTGCSNRCQKVLFDFNGIIDADVSYEKEMATIRYNPDSTNVEKIIKRIEEIGFKAEKSKE
ncbi:MAG: mercuric transporter MerT family protein [Flavobacteriales bacterium]